MSKINNNVKNAAASASSTASKGWAQAKATSAKVASNPIVVGSVQCAGLAVGFGLAIGVINVVAAKTVAVLS